MEPARKNGDGRLREDLEPLTSRFPVLGTPTKARWQSGTLGSDRVPGPSSYWIDAVVWVTPDVASRLVAADPDAVGRPDLVPGVADFVPAGEYRTSSALNELFVEGEWRGQAFASGDGSVVLLSAKGQ